MNFLPPLLSTWIHLTLPPASLMLLCMNPTQAERSLTVSNSRTSQPAFSLVWSLPQLTLACAVHVPTLTTSCSLLFARSRVHCLSRCMGSFLYISGRSSSSHLPEPCFHPLALSFCLVLSLCTASVCPWGLQTPRGQGLCRKTLEGRQVP